MTTRPPPQDRSIEGVLRDLLLDLFAGDELRLWLLRFPWGRALTEDLTQPASAAVTAAEVAARLRSRGLLTPALFDALRAQRPGRAADIDLIEAMVRTPPRPAPAPTRRPALRRWLLLVGGLALAAYGGWSLLTPPAEAPEPEPVQAPVDHAVAPAPRTPLELALVYVDTPSALAPGSHVRALAAALRLVLRRSPRAVLLVPALAQGVDVAPLVEVLRSRGPGGPAVLGLLPDPEGMALAPPTSGDVQPYRPALPLCAGGADRGCLDLMLPSPFDPVDPAWVRSSDPRRQRREDAPLDRLGPCVGTTPTAPLALVLLARDGASVVEDGGAALERACRVDVAFSPGLAPEDPCRAPWSWAWASELEQGALGAGADPLGRAGPAACPDRARLVSTGGLRDRIVVLADPRPDGGALRATVIEGRAEGGTRSTQTLTEAEALALAAWSTLGWLEAGP